MSFEKVVPDWQAKGIEPPQSKRETGWEVEDRPPAAWLNWFMNLTAESLQELQAKAVEKEYVDEQISEVMDEVASAKQAGNERKAEVVAALIAKGIQATTSESWDTLIPKIVAIVTATGNATLADVLAGKTFSTPVGNSLVGTAMPKVPNLIKNGSFEKDLKGWRLEGLTATFPSSQPKFGTKNIAINVKAASTEGYILQTLSYVSNHKYYACGYAFSNIPFTMDVFFPLIPPYSATLGMPIAGGNVWRFFSGIIPAISTVPSQKAEVRFDFNNGSVNLDAWADGLMLIDLTESFGAGKEPSKETMDSIVQGAGGWWDSVIPTIANDYSAYPTGVANGYVGAKSAKGDGAGSLVVEPISGYYESGLNPTGFGAILTSDPEFVPSSFLADRNIFGVQGSIPLVYEPSTHFTSSGASYGPYSNDSASPFIYFDTQQMVGKYNQNVSWARFPVGDILPQNFRTGKSAFDGQLVGTMVEGKQYATQSESLELTTTNNWDNGIISLVRNNLAFQPTEVILFIMYGMPYYSDGSGSLWYNDVGLRYGANGGSIDNAGMALSITTSVTMSPNGFTISARTKEYGKYGNGTFRLTGWVATR